MNCANPLAELLEVNVSRLLPVVGLGVNDAVTPLGNPDTERFTLPGKLYTSWTVMVVVAEVPCPIVTEFGEAAKEKYGI